MLATFSLPVLLVIISVYREELASITSIIQSVLRAIQEYELRDGKATVVVSDDGLQGARARRSGSTTQVLERPATLMDSRTEASR